MFKLPATPWPGAAVPPGALPSTSTSHTCSSKASSRQRFMVVDIAGSHTTSAGGAGHVAAGRDTTSFRWGATRGN